MRFNVLFPLLVSASLCLPGGVDVRAQTLSSSEAVHGLISALDELGLNAVAASEPAEPGRFVAALYIPGSQLLVVSARHPSDAAIAYRIANREYRDVYLDLQGSPTRESKFFMQDAGADGMTNAPRDRGNIDVLYEDGVRQTLFDGDYKKQQLTSAEYQAKMVAADARYARLLTVLTATARGLPHSQAPSHQTPKDRNR